MRLNIILALLVIATGYFTCKTFSHPTPASTTASAPVGQPVQEGQYPNNPAHVIHDARPDTVQGTFQVKQPPAHIDVPWDKIAKASTSRKAYMATGWWTAKMAYQPSDTTVHVNYLRKWLKFKDDQTFEIYKDNQLLETGHWAYDDDKKIMYISCKDPYFNNTWAVLERGFRMVWKGNTELNTSGIQVRMDNEPNPKW